MPFHEILFEAEISRYEDAEDAEFIEYARRNCDENPKTRQLLLDELRNLIYERGEVIPRRSDDAYLLRFLRARRFIPALAHRLMVRYEDFRAKNYDLYDGIDAFGLQKVKYVYAGVFPDSPDNGRVTLMRFGKWDTTAVPIEDVVRCALMMDELAAMQPKLQILGITIIVDLDGLSLRHIRHLTPRIAQQIVNLMGISFPLYFHGIHVVNYNWLLNSCFYLFKQFIPSGAWNRLHFHGYNMTSLHKYIDPIYLPPEYGGTLQNRIVVTTEEWLAKINKYKDEYMAQELRDLGFAVNN